MSAVNLKEVVLIFNLTISTISKLLRESHEKDLKGLYFVNLATADLFSPSLLMVTQRAYSIGETNNIR